ncbi:MAG: hypothetical protein R3336_03805 [Phycisphaeraceae bacterium]|nr:hypothetical protein [Phycisphaeraceae bacterium]
MTRIAPALISWRLSLGGMIAVAVLALLIAGPAVMADAPAGEPEKADPVSVEENAEQQGRAAEEEAAGEAAASEATGDEPSADDVLEQMVDDVESEEPIEPVRQPADADAPPSVPSVNIKAFGVAPEGSVPTVTRPEGTFVLNRRGRMVDAPDSQWHAFVFDADSAEGPEPPMVLMPCRTLARMEALVGDAGSDQPLEVSGKVFLYRGVNYLLPTRVKRAVDKSGMR